MAISGIGFSSTAVCAAAPAEAQVADKQQTDVPVKVVVLFSSGVGYFEHIGSIAGNASTELRFKTAQINDILKSLLVQDTGGGTISSIVYPSIDPIGKLLRSFQVDITANPSLAELLNQLRGAKVKVTAGTENLAGTILGVEKKPKAVGETAIEIWVLNLISGGTIRSIPLEEVTKLELEDPQLQEELNKALAALAQARDQDKKPVTIQFQGQGERLVRLGYVVETPVWKTSYRLILSGQAEGKDQLQGWAIVENQTDNDWSNVQLSLVSGRPISFIQELYQPLYVPRPVVEPELYASLRPQTYEGGMEDKAGRRALAASPAPAAIPSAPGRGGAREKAAAFGLAGQAGGRFGGGALGDTDGAAFNRPMDPTASVASIASASKVGELFQYTVGSVSLPRQRSAMIPIITEPVQVQKVSIYNASVLAKNPLNGARLKNTTDKHLLAGPITVLEASSYAGDARVDNVPPGQERLLSYGIDLQMLVNSTKHKQESTIVAGSIVKGVLQLQRRNVFTQEYLAENKDTRAKTLVVEHPFRQNWKLVTPTKALETTESLYRFEVKVPAGQQESLTVTEQIVQGEVLAILPADLGTLVFHARNEQISKEVREALAKAAELKGQMVEAERQVNQLQKQMNQITQDQTRIRENIKAAPDKSTLKIRSLEKLEEQEKQIDGLFTAIEAAQKKREALQKQLETYVSGLNVGQ
jgi:hypothetical protein